MRIIKRTLLLALLITAGVLLFRGWLFRQIVTYKSVGIRATYSANNKELIEYIEANIDKQTETNIVQVVRSGLETTSKRLNFTTDKNDNDPNKLMKSRTAHCVGYSSFFATNCNYLLEKHNLDDSWTAKPRIGQLYFLGINVHQYFNSSFFKDHDFVTIENRSTGEVLAVDPAVNDYLHIDFVKYSK